jgi:three-Cys-motif partner protein
MASFSDNSSDTVLPEHSAAKVKLLGEYLRLFLTIIANDGYTKRILLFDLFCGEGIYGDLGEIGDVHYSNRDYNDLIKELITKLPERRDEKSFVFIDPYGYKHIRAGDIQALLSKGNVEVLLFLPTQFMYRFDSNGTPEALVDFIEDIVDYEQWNQSDTVWEFVDQLKIAFRKNLGARIFVDTFTIQKDPQTVFCLFFLAAISKVLRRC